MKVITMMIKDNLDITYVKQPRPAREVKYDIGDVVTFKVGDKVVTGRVEIVDRNGTLEQNVEPSYDVLAEEPLILWKHVRQSWIED